ncbi:hypothetical protein [Streptomyces sp. UNOB3_S3]|uniref:hypothetical protein n=1 Tax=Streptomyces sp. UNOB3_S3 TaxID=2871682 RepID=UPI001E2D6A23|nr:hypothetical protein [Streptomyces sp. UNOB3_S3]MCC3775731.1 hypothetical protein [Streptomyces sp. UNOB3_S3]
MSTSLRVYASYHQYNLYETDAEDDDLELDDDPGNGLVRVNTTGDYVTVTTGTQTGLVTVTYQVLEAAPPLDAAPWDEVVEVSTRFAPPGAGITSPEDDGETASVQPDGAEYGIVLPGTDGQPRWWRMRFHARGRDHNLAAAGDGQAGEEHLILIWPADQAPETCHKLTDQTGKQSRNGV